MRRISLDAETVEELQALLAGYASYDSFSADRPAAFKFVDLVDVRICPYCNINYTYTVFADGGALVLRCDIDHFEAQSKATSKALQHDNLVPSCQPCNSRLKLAKPFTRATHVHPYFDSFDEIKVFRLSIKKTNYLKRDGFEIVFARCDSASLQDDARGDANIRDFRLLERYAMHKPEAVEVLRKIKFYHALRIEEIQRLTHHSGSLEWALFGPDVDDINTVSLGKAEEGPNRGLSLVCSRRHSRRSSRRLHNCPRTRIHSTRVEQPNSLTGHRPPQARTSLRLGGRTSRRASHPTSHSTSRPTSGGLGPPARTGRGVDRACSAATGHRMVSAEMSHLSHS